MPALRERQPGTLTDLRAEDLRMMVGWEAYRVTGAEDICGQRRADPVAPGRVDCGAVGRARDWSRHAAKRFWDAVECFSLTGHSIERKRLRRESRWLFKQENGRVARLLKAEVA